jgi:hypothetical protein
MFAKLDVNFSEIVQLVYFQCTRLYSLVVCADELCYCYLSLLFFNVLSTSISNDISVLSLHAACIWFEFSRRYHTSGKCVTLWDCSCEVFGNNIPLFLKGLHTLCRLLVWQIHVSSVLTRYAMLIVVMNNVMVGACNVRSNLLILHSPFFSLLQSRSSCTLGTAVVWQ